jgi:multisubunit Na+/H+ antiporter MnhB subunit
MARRPLGVTLLVVLIVINGLIALVGGLVLAFQHDDRSVIRQTAMSSDSLLTYGIALVIVGAIYLLIARGLATGGGISRFLVGAVSLLNLIAGIWVAVEKDGRIQTQAIVSAVISAVVLILLYSPRANAFFRTN